MTSQIFKLRLNPLRLWTEAQVVTGLTSCKWKKHQHLANGLPQNFCGILNRAINQNAESHLLICKMWETGLNSGSSLFSSRSHKRKGGSRTTFRGRHTSGHREQTCHCDFILHPFSTHLLPAKKAHWNSAECMLTTNEHEMLLP